VPQALHLRRRLGLHIVLKGRVVGHHGAGEHEVLPNQDALGVASFEECLGRVDAAAPNPKHVHVGVHRVLNHVEPWGCVGEVVKVWRHHVRAARKHRDALNGQLERRAVFVGGLDPFQVPNSPPLMADLARRPVRPTHLVQRLISHVDGPPELRMGDDEGVASPLPILALSVQGQFKRKVRVPAVAEQPGFRGVGVDDLHPRELH